jgi:hypothetical protein
MNRTLLESSIVTLILLGLSSTTAAHHPPRFEQCQRLTATGHIEEIAWANPHVELSIKSDEGVDYKLIWLNLQQLSRAGIDPGSLDVGDRVVITAIKRAGDTRSPMLLSEIRRPADGFQWTQSPQGC